MNIIFLSIKHNDIVRTYFPDATILKDRSELEKFDFKSFNPDYVFSLYWSWKIPSYVWSNYLTIGFHMTDLPFGRGGSPYENLISRGIYDTKITAFKVNDVMDAGDVVMKKDFRITNSKYETIRECFRVIFNDMIPHILIYKPIPHVQTGRVVEFKRMKLNVKAK